MSFRRQQVAALTATGIVLFGLGLAITWIGCKAIREQSWTTTSTVSRTAFLGPVAEGERSTVTKTYEGTDAQVVGGGLAAFGLMLVVWGVGCFSVAIQPILNDRPGLLSILSAVLFAHVVVLLMPPWTVGHSLTAACFWGAIVVWTAAGFAMRWRRKWVRAVVVPLFLATLLLELSIPIEASGGAILGLVATGGAFAHGLYLYPPWRQWAVARDRADRAQSAAPVV